MSQAKAEKRCCTLKRRYTSVTFRENRFSYQRFPAVERPRYFQINYAVTIIDVAKYIERILFQFFTERALTQQILQVLILTNGGDDCL